MATTYIQIDETKLLGRRLKSCRNKLLEHREELRELLGIMARCIDGADYTLLESVFGIPTGKGSEAYAELLSYKATVDSAGSSQGTTWGTVFDATEQIITKFG